MMATDDDDGIHAKCVATTGDSFCESISVGHEGQNLTQGNVQSNRFSKARFTADGTSVVTENADRCLRTFVLPVDLLDEPTQPHNLDAHCRVKSATSIQSFEVYPHFNLSEPSTSVYLYAPNDLPITLNNAIYSDVVHAKYRLIHHQTEAYIAPKSLAWTRDGNRFVAGSESQISVFDASYDGSEPFLIQRSTVGKTQRKRYGGIGVNGCKGLVTALSIGSDGTLAAGTTMRQIALYSNEGNGECQTAFSVGLPSGEKDSTKGHGIMELAWSPDGTYLLAAERQSNGIHVYDVRHTLRRVAWLDGRNAQTTQRLGMDVVPTETGFEAWAGGKDGCVRMWKNPGSSEGEQTPDATIPMHDGPISGTIWHPHGAVLATCSGRREIGSTNLFADDEDQDMARSRGERPLENTLKIWSV